MNSLILLVDKLLRERVLKERKKDINTVYFGLTGCLRGAINHECTISVVLFMHSKTTACLVTFSATLRELPRNLFKNIRLFH